MKYENKTFTLPVGSNRVDQQRWDHAFLSDAEYLKKYGKKKPK